jgi:hypothetical protein
MKRIYILYAIILIILYQSCGTGCKGTIYSFSEIERNKTPTTNDYPDANAVYLLREAKFEIQKVSTFSEHIIIKVLKEGGKKYANVKIPFWRECEVLDLKARTIRPNGEIINLNKKDIFEVSDFPEYVLYADKKAKVFTFPSVDTGCILEYTYTLGYRGPYVPLWYFQADEPTVLAKFTYDVPIFLGFDYLASSVPGCKIEKEKFKQRNRHKTIFTARELPAIRPEPLAPPINDISSWIMMAWASFRLFFLPEIRSGLETWYEIGKNYSLVTDSLLQPTSEIKGKTAELVADCNSDEEKISKISEFVRDNCRYVAVDVEGHRIIPNSPERVLKNQYGDCKDLSGLLISMLRAANISAYPVLVKTKSAGKFIERFPAVSQINHVVTAIALKHITHEASLKNAIVYGNLYFSSDDDYIIIDPTALTYPPGQLHFEIQGRNAILCAGFDSELMILPATSFKNNFCSNEIIFNLDDDDYFGKIKMQFRGDDAALLRYKFLHSSSTEITNFIQEYVSEFPLKITIDTFEILHITDFDSSLMINVKFKKFSPLQTAKEQILIPVMFKSFGRFRDIYSCPQRTHNIEFDYPHMRNDVFRLVVPKGYTLQSLPERENHKNEWCEYSCSSYILGDTIIVNRNLAVKECIVPKAAFAEMTRFSAKVLDSSHKIIILSKKY